MRHLHNRKVPIPLYNLNDLTKIEILQNLAQDFLLKYQNIEKCPVFSLNGLSIKEMSKIAVMQNESIRKEFKTSHKKTFLRYRKSYNELITKSNIHYQDVELKITDKLFKLINS